MADSAGQPLKMHGREADMLRFGCAEPAQVPDLGVIFTFPQMASPAAEAHGVGIFRIPGLPFITPDHPVRKIMTVAVHASQAGRSMHVFRSLEAALPNFGHRMTVQAALVIDLVGNIKKNTVFGIEQLRPVFHIGNYRPLRIIRIGPVKHIPGSR